MTMVQSSQAQGSKQKRSGLEVNGAVNLNEGRLELELQFTNQSGGPIADFDLMVNKNSFGVGLEGSCKGLGITYPDAF